MNPTDKQIIKFYNSVAWKRARLAKLNRDPLCSTCKLAGLIVPAVTVHHSLPVRTHWSLRFDVRYLFSLCEPCHKSIEGEIKSRI